MNFLDKSAILGANDLPIEVVEVPEWGASVRVRAMSVTELIAFNAAREKAPEEATGSLLVAFGACDESGAFLFSADEVAALQAKNPHAIKTVAKVVMRINRLGDDQAETTAKNS